MTSNEKLTRGQAVVLALAVVPMLAAGGLGAWGTFTNVVTEFGRAATALGVVAAGEGATLVLALVMVGLTMLGQAAPAAVRLGLWAAPASAAVTGLVVADTGTEAVVYAMTPMAMCVSAEGLGLLARRIVVHRTGVDAEQLRRNAETVQRLAYHRARSTSHPSASARKRSERAAWRLARRVGVGDAELGARLVDVQRERLQEGADTALQVMFGAPVDTPALPPVDQPSTAVDVDVDPTPAETEQTESLQVESVDTPGVDQVSTGQSEAPEVDGPAPTWESESAAAVDWVLSGEGDMPTRTVDAADRPKVVDVDEPERLSTEEARTAIEEGWKAGESIRSTATAATRHPSYVARVYRELEEARGPQPTPGQLTLLKREA